MDRFNITLAMKAKMITMHMTNTKIKPKMLQKTQKPNTKQ